MGPIPYGAPVADVPLSIAGGTASLGEVFGAAAEQGQLVDNSNAAITALEEAYGNRSQAIKAATGVDPGNPLVLSDSERIEQQEQQALAPYASAAAPPQTFTLETRDAAYMAKLQELARQFPQYADVIKADTPVRSDAEALARDADQKFGDQLASNPSWPASVASFAGGAAASFRDPIVIASLFAGGGAGGARTVLGGILKTAATEALVNGATTAAQQPSVQAWRKEAGLPNGFDQAAQNVLAAAALGGVFGAGSHAAAEAVGKVVETLLPKVAEILDRVRPALPADARGALDAADQEAVTAAAAPQGVAPARFDSTVSRADAAAQGLAVPEPVTPANNDFEVNQIVQSLAPHPDSVSGPAVTRPAGESDRLVSDLTKPTAASQRPPTPILDYLRNLGGVDPGSPAADELRAVGVTKGSIFRKGGLTALDNLPHDELPVGSRFAIADDGNGYADQDALIRAAGEEANGAGGDSFAVDQERAALEAQGVDFSAPAAEVRAKLAELDEIDRRYRAAEPNEEGLATDEVTSVPAGVTRRAHTEALVRRVLELQPGLGADRVREAVNLSLFENTPIEQAVSDAMSDAAGAPREAEAIGQAYDAVRANPTGPVDDPLVRIAPRDIEGTMLERGAFRDLNEVDVRRGNSGHGLVKIIWKHGEESDKPAHLRVSKADIMALPRVVRDFEARVTGPTREWRVMRDGRLVHYADKVFDGDRHVVTIFVEDPAREGAGRPLSERRASQPVPQRFSSADGDTADRLAGTGGATERPDGSIDLETLPSNPPALLDEPASTGDGEDGKVDFDTERSALEELGYGSDVKLPIGDELVSLDELEARMEESRREMRVVEACKE